MLCMSLVVQRNSQTGIMWWLSHRILGLLKMVLKDSRIKIYLLLFIPDSEWLFDPTTPRPLFDELRITVFVDSDCAYDKLTHGSITAGVIILLGRCMYSTRLNSRELLILPSLGSEFMSMK